MEKRQHTLKISNGRLNYVTEYNRSSEKDGNKPSTVLSILHILSQLSLITPLLGGADIFPIFYLRNGYTEELSNLPEIDGGAWWSRITAQVV